MVEKENDQNLMTNGHSKFKKLSLSSGQTN
ncbi:hypothetical protein JOC76_004487 [Neobacillus cucumis]|nr:hypothetical protein [Neobacillus cucumis]